MNRKRTDYIVIHVTATPPGWKGGRAGIAAMHKALGWSGIGYNELILDDGRAVVGRGYDAVGAHVAGFNSIAYGIAWIGGVDAKGKPDISTISAAQWATMERRLRELVRKYPKARICGHRDLSPDLDKDGMIESGEHIKACPCFDAIPWARSKGLPSANIRGEWDRKAPAAPEGPDARNAYLQRLLSRAGFAFGPVDGIVGPRTVAAIKQYQSKFGLAQTGAFDDATVAHLRTKFEAPQPPQDAREPSAGPSLQKPQGTPAAPVSGGVAALFAAGLAAIGAAVAAGWDRIVQFFTF